MDIYKFAQMRGDPTGETGPTPAMVSMVEYGGEAFWKAANWPIWMVRTMMDEVLVHPGKMPRKEFAAIKRLMPADPIAAWQIELDKIRIAYDGWRGPRTLKDFPEVRAAHERGTEQG